MKLKLELVGNKCNNYPHLTISHNQETLYSEFVVERTIIELDINLQSHNTITIEGMKKSQGENGIWDTLVDSTGTVVQDKNILFNNIWFDGIAMDKFWFSSLPMCAKNKLTTPCNMGMWDNGFITFNIGLPLLDWIIEEKFIKVENDQSKSATVYNSEYRFEYAYIQEKINSITRLLND